jgi:5'-nucleotidase
VLILVTNDDGVHSPGLLVLAEQLAALGEVVVVAPDRERSAVSHSLTLHAPLRADELQPGFFAVDGTPTDCVNLAIHGLLRRKPDLVVSGINRGGNMGDDLTYSGTVAAAMEATLMGVPALALSLDAQRFLADDFVAAAAVAVDLARRALDSGLPPETFLNINVPAGVPAGMRLTRQGRRRFSDEIEKKSDPRGRSYYWLGAGQVSFDHCVGTDFQAVSQGYVSITPLHLDMTNYRSFTALAAWGISGAEEAKSQCPAA